MLYVKKNVFVLNAFNVNGIDILVSTVPNSIMCLRARTCTKFSGKNFVLLTNVLHPCKESQKLKIYIDFYR